MSITTKEQAIWALSAVEDDKRFFCADGCNGLTSRNSFASITLEGGKRKEIPLGGRLMVKKQAWLMVWHFPSECSPLHEELG